MDILEEDAALWNAWQETWEGWKPIADVPELKALLKKKVIAPPPKPSAAVPPPIPKIPPIPKMAAPAPAAVAAPKTGPQLPVMVGKPNDGKRKHERIEIRLRVIIRNAQMTFRTFSKDISLGGIALENAVPEHLFDAGCHIFIAGPDGHENLRFDLGATSRNDLRFFSFANLDERFMKKLGDWLEKHAKSKSSKAG